MSRACDRWRRLFASAASKKSKAWVDPYVDFPYSDSLFIDSHTHLQSTFSSLRAQATRDGTSAPEYKSSLDFHRYFVARMRPRGCECVG